MPLEIIFLNTLNAEIRQPISQFISDHANTTDVFCFQEASDGDNGMRQLAAALLPDYVPFYADKSPGHKDNFSQATYVHPRIPVLRQDIVFPDNLDVGLGITTQINYHGTPLAICNFHGRSRPGDKLDTPERLVQSQGLIDCFRSLALPLILGGDFNLDIHSSSIDMLQKAGYRNLITEYAIRTTRNRIIWDKYPDTPQLYSDYVFVSPDISVTGFTVPENEISDHLPLILRLA